jgi:hypothetical protein
MEKREKSMQRARPETVRVTITFSVAALAWLENEADQYAVSITELLRRLVDETRGAHIVRRHEVNGR